jgi:pyruvate dehydrogenase (quinone)
MAELLTIARYWQEWSDPRLVVAVLHNNDLNQVTWEMRAMEGAPKFVESQSLPDCSYAKFASSLGLDAIEVTEAGKLADAWRMALSADRPTVLDVYTDPNVPPIPPHTTIEQMKAMGRGLLHGDEDALQVLTTGVKQKVQEFLPGTKSE